MPMPKDPDPNNPTPIREQIKHGFHATNIIGAISAECVTPFIRNRFGVYTQATSGPCALVAMLIYAAATNSAAMFYYVYVWLAFAFWRRIRADHDEHSRYNGYPWFVMRVFGISNEYRAKTLGPFIVLVIGLCIYPFSEPLGGFLMLLWVPMQVKAGIDQEIDIQQVRAMRDVEIEVKHRMKMFRR